MSEGAGMEEASSGKSDGDKMLGRILTEVLGAVEEIVEKKRHRAVEESRRKKRHTAENASTQHIDKQQY